MARSTLISADSHVIEPADLWTSRIDRQFRDRAPHVVKELDGVKGDFFLCEEVPPFDVSGLAVAGVDPRDYEQRMAAGYPGVRPSGWDPAERIKDQDVDSVQAEVLYTSLGLVIYGIADAELRAASFRAFNDWLAEFCAYDRRRFVGIGLIPTDDVEQAAREVARCAQLGLKGGMIWASPPDDRPYDSASWDPLWAAAQDHAMPLSLHILTGAKGSGITDSVMKGYPCLPYAIAYSMNNLIFGGALERFPRLQIVSVEVDVGWLGHFIQRMDHSYEKYRFLEKGTVIPEPPSFYFDRQVYSTFQDDRLGIQTQEAAGLNNLMWASDFPHSDSTWPKSLEVIGRDFEGVAEAVTRQIVFENCATLYEIVTDR